MKHVLVCGASGFIGRHLVRRLKAEGHRVRGADISYSPFGEFEGDEFFRLDLRKPESAGLALSEHQKHGPIEEVYQLAADMGGMGYIGGGHDADIMTSSSLINLSLAGACLRHRPKVFFSSSACVYPAYPIAGKYSYQETDAYPADPDSDYGWEKLFSERLWQAYWRDYDLDVRIARFHNIFGPEGTFTDPRAKAPAALCRKIAELPPEGGTISLWGDGSARRSFLFVDECLEGILRLMSSDFSEPMNIGSSRMLSIRELAFMIAEIAGKSITVGYADGPVGVPARNSDNFFIRAKLGWSPAERLEEGLEKTYRWVDAQVKDA